MTKPLVEDGPLYSPVVVQGLPDLARLVGHCRQTGTLVCYSNSPKGHAGYGIPDAISPAPGDVQLLHEMPGAFGRSDLERLLSDRDRNVVLVAGTATDRGCRTTARQAAALGFKPIMVRGACFTNDITEGPFGPIPREEIERVHLASLYRMGAGVMTVDEVVSRLK